MKAWGRYVWWGLVAAIAASLAAAYVIHRFEVVEDAYEGWLMLVGLPLSPPWFTGCGEPANI